MRVDSLPYVLGIIPDSSTRNKYLIQQKSLESSSEAPPHMQRRRAILDTLETFVDEETDDPLGDYKSKASIIK